MTDIPAGDVQPGGQVIPMEQPAPVDPEQQVQYEVEHELEKAIHAMALKGQIADGDADGAWRFGQAAHFYAQALQVLRTPIAPAGNVGETSGERPVGSSDSAE